MPIQPDQRTSETRRIEELIVESLPDANVDAYKQNSAAIRVRVVDSGFAGKSRSEREDLVLPLLRTLPDEILGDIVLLLLLTPEESGRSMMNMEFEDPVPSSL